jgi:predicted ATPase
MRKNYGQELNSFSHGEAYLKIIEEKLENDGIYLLDEPEAALSPAKQLSLIYQINEHLKSNMSQFVIATHSPILMSIPNATIYEITENGMEKTDLEDTEHYSITKNFLNNPEIYLRHLE